MIAGIRGTVRRAEPGVIVVSVGPLDVRVAVPAPLALQLCVGDEVTLHTHLRVREDLLALYGFASGEELGIFELLLGVSGVGPKLALGMLSALAPTTICRAIASEEAQTLARAPGVGTRAAARIVAELKTKIGPEMVGLGEPPADGHSAAVAALVGMGYSPAEVRRATERIPSQDSIEEVLRQGLAFLADRK